MSAKRTPAERTFDPLPPHNREGDMDRATSLLRQSPFDRPTVLMLCRVLEDAWLSVHLDFAERNAEIAGRKNIADGILAFARAGQRDPQILRHYAISRALSLLGPRTGTTRDHLAGGP